jgi:O-antigen ligase
MSTHSGARLRLNPGLLIAGLLISYLVVTSVWDPLPGFGVYDGKRIVQVWLILLCLLTTLLSAPLCGSVGALIRATPNWVLALSAGALLLGIASAFSHPPVAYPLVEVSLPFLVIVMFYVIAACRQQAGERFDRWLLIGLAVLGGLVALQEAMGVLAGWSMSDPFRFEYMTVHFAHPRFYNHLQTLSIPLLATLPWVFTASRRVKGLAIALLALQWCLLLMSGGRGSALGLVLGLGLVGMLTFRRRPGWLGLQLAGIAAGALLFIALLAMQDRMFATSSDNPAAGQMAEQSVGRYTSSHGSGRKILWQEAWRQSLDHPLVGIGPGRYACIAPPRMGSHPHSLPMQLLSEWGWPATAMFAMVALWAGLAMLLRLCRTDPPLPPFAQALVASLVALAVHASVSGVLMAPASLFAVVLAGGCLLGILATGTGNGMGARANLAPARVILGLAVLASLALAVFASIDLNRVHGDLASGMSDARLAPRFWQIGDICLLER